LSPEQTRRLLEFIAAKRAEGFVGGSELNVTCGEENYWGPEWEMRVRSHFHHCSSGTNIGSILHDGSVIGCPNVSHRYIEGNIRDARFADIWRGAFFRYRSGVLDQASERCRGCAHWDLCEGGGFHLFDPEDPNAVHCGMLRSGADPDGWRNGPQDCGHGGCAGCGG